MASEEAPAQVATVTQPCMLGYPDRFEAAAKFISNHASGGKSLKQDTQLLLYALGNQATKGPCNLGKPGGWLGGNAAEVAMWQSWKSLGDMNPFEAMRLYVRTVEEEQPDWYGILVQGDAASDSPAGAEAAEAASGTDVLRPAADYAVASTWSSVNQGSQRKPLPRYEHAAAMLAGSLCVVGGNYSGRYLSDVWKLDVKSMAWSQLQTKLHKAEAKEADRAAKEQQEDGAAAAADKQQQADAAASTAAAAAGTKEQQEEPQSGLPPIAGHTVTVWNDTLIILGGHSKPKDAPPSLPVRIMDPAGNVAVVEPHGAAPPPRGSHTASLIGRHIYMFGGEDPHRRAIGDLWSLDLDSMTWSQPEVAGKPPSARSAHTAVAYDNRFLLIFGGGSVATCFSDLHVLDTHAIPMQWSQPLVEGLKVTPRAGHSGLLVGAVWYIMGGGNNVKGCTDMLALDLSNLESGKVSWQKAASIPLRDPLSSEGISLVRLPAPDAAPDEQAGIILGFGGYNGKYQNSISVIRVPGQLPLPEEAAGEPPLPSAGPAAASQVGTEPADVKASASAGGAAAASAAPKPQPPPPPKTDAQLVSELRVQLEGAQRDAEAALKEAAAAKETAGHELALLRKQLNTAHTAVSEANKGAEDAKAALSREREKVMKLEVEIAELKKKLAAAAEVQKEVEALRRSVKEAEEKKGSSGMWGFISGQ